jgi:hypothetical protein
MNSTARKASISACNREQAGRLHGPLVTAPGRMQQQD